jgi:ABC-type uncharacterized transport system YnjBCD ATPase subunit
MSVTGFHGPDVWNVVFSCPEAVKAKQKRKVAKAAFIKQTLIVTLIDDKDKHFSAKTKAF